MTTSKIKIGTIDCTPTWREILPTLLTIYRDGNPAGARVAFEELARMASLADLEVARHATKRNHDQLPVQS